MFFKYPDKFIVPVDLFRKAEDSLQIIIDNGTDMESLRNQYDADKEIWAKIDNLYSKSETGTFDDN